MFFRSEEQMFLVCRSEEQGKFQVLKMGKCSHDNPKVISVEMPRLQLVLSVLEHDLDELVQVEPEDGRPGTRRRPVGRPRTSPGGCSTR